MTSGSGAATESVYTVVSLVGSSSESWERAAAVAIERAGQTLRDLRVARIVEQDVHIEDGTGLTYRVRNLANTSWTGLER